MITRLIILFTAFLSPDSIILLGSQSSHFRETNFLGPVETAKFNPLANPQQWGAMNIPPTNWVRRKIDRILVSNPAT